MHAHPFVKIKAAMSNGLGDKLKKIHYLTSEPGIKGT